MENISVHIKQEMRRLALAERDAMSEGERTAASAIICAKIERALEKLGLGSVVAVYAPMKSEVDISGFIAWCYEHDLRVAFPCMNQKGATPRMHMRFVTRDAWEAGTVPFIAKPIKRFAEDDATLHDFPLCHPSNIDAIIVPMVAFDSSFQRLGYGGGNYDEYLGLVSRETTVIGAAFETQRVPRVPTEPHDLPLPLIISA